MNHCPEFHSILIILTSNMRNAIKPDEHSTKTQNHFTPNRIYAKLPLECPETCFLATIHHVAGVRYLNCGLSRDRHWWCQRSFVCGGSLRLTCNPPSFYGEVNPIVFCFQKDPVNSEIEASRAISVYGVLMTTLVYWWHDSGDDTKLIVEIGYWGKFDWWTVRDTLLVVWIYLLSYFINFFLSLSMNWIIHL